MADNRRYIFNILSFALTASGICVLPALITSLVLQETAAMHILVCTLLLCISSGILFSSFGGRTVSDIRPRIMYMTVVFTWLLLILISSFTFYFGVGGISPADAFMEAAASWTGTAASSFDCSRLPCGLMLWRSTCNWLGGIGIVLLSLSLLPSRRYVGYGLASIEFPGPDFLKEESDFRRSYRRLFVIYAALTIAQFALLIAAGMPGFTALLSALSNTSTAGLHHINNSVIISLPGSLKLILTVFAFLGSVNSMIFVYACRREPRKILKSSELKFRLARIMLSIIAVSLFIGLSTPGAAVRDAVSNAAMQTVSFISTSGFITADTGSWPVVCIILIFIQMFIGSSALSTGGGIKDARLVVAFKSISYTLYRHIHPNSVRTLSFDKKPMKSDSAVRANLFIALFLITYLLGALLLSLDNISVYDALTYSQAMITCTGTSPGSISGSDLVLGLSSFGKVVSSLLMICGRLEIYPLMMLFFRGFWKSDSAL